MVKGRRRTGPVVVATLTTVISLADVISVLALEVKSLISLATAVYGSCALTTAARNKHAVGKTEKRMMGAEGGVS